MRPRAAQRPAGWAPRLSLARPAPREDVHRQPWEQGEAVAPFQNTFCPSASSDQMREGTSRVGRPQSQHQADGAPAAQEHNVSSPPSARLETVTPPLQPLVRREHSGGPGKRSKRGGMDTEVTGNKGAERRGGQSCRHTRCWLRTPSPTPPGMGVRVYYGPPPLCQTWGASHTARARQGLAPRSPEQKRMSAGDSGPAGADMTIPAVHRTRASARGRRGRPDTPEAPAALGQS